VRVRESEVADIVGEGWGEKPSSGEGSTTVNTSAAISAPTNMIVFRIRPTFSVAGQRKNSVRLSSPLV
jgi:hypothetical protein